MELAQDTARNILAPLFKNNKILSRDIFDDKDRMRKNISAHIKKAFPFIKEELLLSLKLPIKDIVCFGAVCGFLYDSKSPIDVAFLVDTSLPDDVLKRMSISLPIRGYQFKIYDHPLFFKVLNARNMKEPNWSLMYHRWNIKPENQEFKYDIDFFLKEYTKLNNHFHAALDGLPKNKDGICFPESCQVIKEYFKNLENKAFDALENSPEHEYSLEYNLWLALDIFNVREHWYTEVLKSEHYYLSGEDNG